MSRLQNIVYSTHNDICVGESVENVQKSSEIVYKKTRKRTTQRLTKRKSMRLVYLKKKIKVKK